MRLTLDWDSEALKEMHLPAVLDRDPVGENQKTLAEFVESNLGADVDHSGKWELWTSSNHARAEEGEGGYHYIEYDLGGNLEKLRSLRMAYGDDKLRISLDGDRIEWGSPYVQAMYHMKNIRPHEHKPYETPNRAQLVERHWPTEEYVETKNEDGSLNYPEIIEALADHADFGSRAALFRRIQQRGSVAVSTDPSKRAYDLVNGRRSPTRNEAKALRDYAESREIGHYGDQQVPEELAAKQTRTMFHEYLQVPEVDFGGHTYDEEGESEWLPANIRTGSYGSEVDEMTLKQVHDRIADHMVDVLSPGYYQQQDGERVWQGIELSRWDEMISLERDRPLDPDEVARYRQVLFQNQPGTTEDRVRDLLDLDPFGDSSIMWEVIVYDDEDAFKGDTSTGYWWIARGVLDASDPDHVQNPIRNSTIIADTEGWL